MHRSASTPNPGRYGGGGGGYSGGGGYQADGAGMVRRVPLPRFLLSFRVAPDSGTSWCLVMASRDVGSGAGRSERVANEIEGVDTRWLGRFAK